MGLTPKQERNGAVGDAGERAPSPGPMPDVAPLIGQAEAAAVPRGADGHSLFSSAQGSGPASSSGAESPDRQLGAGGSAWEWDSGLAISELGGEA